MLAMLKFDRGSAWLSGLGGGEKVEKLKGQGMEQTIHADIEIRKNHDRRSKEEIHKQVLTTRGGLTRGSVDNMNRWQGS